MPRFRFSKLVRDNIVNQQIASGAVPQYRSLDQDAHKRELVAKLTEEAQELLDASPETQAEELADVQQVLDDLREVLGVDAQAVADAQARKNATNGAFKKGIYIESVEVPEDNQWVPYYRKNVDRYPEILD